MCCSTIDPDLVLLHLTVPLDAVQQSMSSLFKNRLNVQNVVTHYGILNSRIADANFNEHSPGGLLSWATTPGNLPNIGDLVKSRSIMYGLAAPGTMLEKEWDDEAQSVGAGSGTEDGIRGELLRCASHSVLPMKDDCV